MDQRKLLREAIALEFENTAPTGDAFDRLVDLVVEVIGDKVYRPAVVDSLRHLAGTHLDARLIDETAWRMAGNVKRLGQRKPVPPWHGQRLAEWAPAQITSCRRARNGRGVMGARLTVRMLAGTACGLHASRWWSLKMCRFVSADMGWTRQRQGDHVPARFLYSVPEQLVGLRTYVLLTPDLSGREPGFKITAPHPSVRRWNRYVIQARTRSLRGFRCRLKLPDDYPCHKCPIGFENCTAGTHRKDYKTAPCAGCGRNDAWHDPESAADVCVDCEVKNAYRRDAK